MGKIHQARNMPILISILTNMCNEVLVNAHLITPSPYPSQLQTPWQGINPAQNRAVIQDL
jgi:hypothetical protein